MVSIRIAKLEGRSIDMEEVLVESWDEANHILWCFAKGMREDPTLMKGGYEKVQINITFEDGWAFNIQYDLYPLESKDEPEPNLCSLIVDHCLFYSGYYMDHKDLLPKHLTYSQYETIMVDYSQGVREYHKKTLQKMLRDRGLHDLYWN